MRLQQLRYLVAAADSSSYTQAAKKCFTSRQNIARSIKELEDELGVELFERGDAGIKLTAIGQSVVLQACAVLLDVDELTSMLSKSDLSAAVTTIAVSSNIPSKASPKILNGYFIENSPRLRFLERCAQDCYEAVCSHEADMALVLGMKQKFPKCVAVDLSTQAAYALVGNSHPFARQETVSVRELSTQRIIFPAQSPFQCGPLVQQLAMFHYDFNNSSDVQNSHLVKIVLRDNASVAIVPEVHALDPADKLVPVPLEGYEYMWHLYMLYRRGSEERKSMPVVCSEIRHLFLSNAE